MSQYLQGDFQQYGEPGFGGQEQVYAQQPQYAIGQTATGPQVHQQPVHQMSRQSVSPQRQVMQHPQGMPVQQAMSPSYQPPVQRMQQPMPVVKSRAPQQVVMQPVHSAPPQAVIAQQPMFAEQQVFVEQPAFYEEQPQFVEQQQVQYVEQPVQYVEQQEEYFAPPTKPVVVKSAPPQHFEPQYAQQPVKYVKSGPPPQRFEQYMPEEQQYFEDIDPIEPDYFEQKPKVVRKSVKNVSPRITKMPVKQSIDQRSNTIPVPVKKTFETYDDEQEFSHDDWQNIKSKIDRQYERKLKEVGDDALKKLKMFKAEHQALLEKTQFMIEHSRIEDEYQDEFVDQRFSQTERKVPNDRNRFFTQPREEEFEYKKPVQLKNSAKGPQVIRKSQPALKEQVMQSAPQQKRIVQQPVQQVKQFVQQPVYHQPVQVVQQQPQYTPVHQQQQQPVRYVVPQQQQQPQFYQAQQPAIQQNQYVPPPQPVKSRSPVRKSHMQQPKQTPKLSPQQAQELRMTFDMMDQDGNGSVTREELKSMLYGLGEMVSDEYIDDMISKADTNRDGKIQFDEFVRSATQGTI